MGDAALVEGLLADSFELVRRLDSINLAPTLVAWYYYEDEDAWRLLIAGLDYDRLLATSKPLAYQRIVEAITAADLNSLSIGQVKLIETTSPLTKALSIMVRTPPDGIITGHLSNTMLNGIFIKEAILLRAA